MEELVFNIRHTVYWIDTSTGQPIEHPQELISLLYGQTFKGETVYQGRFAKGVAQIKQPLLFVKTEDFRNSEIFQRANIPERKKVTGRVIDLMMRTWVDCHVIAFRQNFQLIKNPAPQ
jgi:hypothetical protein